MLSHCTHVEETLTSEVVLFHAIAALDKMVSRFPRENHGLVLIIFCHTPQGGVYFTWTAYRSGQTCICVRDPSSGAWTDMADTNNKTKKNYVSLLLNQLQDACNSSPRLSGKTITRNGILRARQALRTGYWRESILEQKVREILSLVEEDVENICGRIPDESQPLRRVITGKLHDWTRSNVANTIKKNRVHGSSLSRMWQGGIQIGDRAVLNYCSHITAGSTWANAYALVLPSTSSKVSIQVGWGPLPIRQ